MPLLKKKKLNTNTRLILINTLECKINGEVLKVRAVGKS